MALETKPFSNPMRKLKYFPKNKALMERSGLFVLPYGKCRKIVLDYSYKRGELWSRFLSL